MRRTPLRSLSSLWRVALAGSILWGCAPAPAPTPDSELILYGWEGDMPQSVLDAFAQEYGVKVTYEVYESQEEAIANMKAGRVYDVVTMESRFIPMLAEAGLLAEINFENVANIRNISSSFRDLAYDPGNRHSLPYNWGTTGLVVRSDLLDRPVTGWADLWNPDYAGKIGLWYGQRREVIALTLKSLGYSANSENPAELEAALKRLIALKPDLVRLEDFDLETATGVLLSGRVVIAMGYAGDVLDAREQNDAVSYVLPEEGALLWSDTFIIPAASPRQTTAELFLNFVLRPEISAQIVNTNHFPMPNDAAVEWIEPDILQDPVIFPPTSLLKNAELILPLSQRGQQAYDDIWARFVAADQ